MVIPDAARRGHERWLLELTQVPTAAGRERRVIDWISRWASERPDLTLDTDPAGNLVLAAATERRAAPPRSPPIYFTAHLDHPAFVVERTLGPHAVTLSFRGGVLDDYFPGARVTIHAHDGSRLPATIADSADPGGDDTRGVFKHYLAELDGAPGTPAPDPRPGDIATWTLPPAQIRDGLLHAPACDDLAAVAAALAAFDLLRDPARLADHDAQDVRLLFTRAEEVGFLGAMAACRHATMPRDARVIALENSRSFDDSPIGAGPIVRVGDRLSTFDPALTAALAQRAEDLASGRPNAQPAPTLPAPSRAEAPRPGNSPRPDPAARAPAAAPTAAAAGPNASTPSPPPTPWKWQRKLMPGGACEATVFCAAGYQATCLCLPLGNYHNMADLAAVQARTHTAPPAIAPEFISVADFHALVDLLVACGQRLPASPPVQARLDKLWHERAWVLAGK